MELFSSAVFWGIIIILIGLSLIFKEVFQFSIPVVRILFGLFFIWLGFKVIFGIKFKSAENQSLFNSSPLINYNVEQKEYNTLFGNSTFDLRDLTISGENKKVEVNVIFGNGKILLDKTTPVKYKMSTAFGTAVSPGNSVNGFGENTWKSPGFDENSPHLTIKGSAVFGRLELEQK